MNDNNHTDLNTHTVTEQEFLDDPRPAFAAAASAPVRILVDGKERFTLTLFQDDLED